jgi:hypothetical protein
LDQLLLALPPLRKRRKSRPSLPRRKKRNPSLNPKKKEDSEIFSDKLSAVSHKISIVYVF